VKNTQQTPLLAHLPRTIRRPGHYVPIHNKNGIGHGRIGRCVALLTPLNLSRARPVSPFFVFVRLTADIISDDRRFVTSGSVRPVTFDTVASRIASRSCCAARAVTLKKKPPPPLSKGDDAREGRIVMGRTNNG